MLKNTLYAGILASTVRNKHGGWYVDSWHCAYIDNVFTGIGAKN